MMNQLVLLVIVCVRLQLFELLELSDSNDFSCRIMHTLLETTLKLKGCQSTVQGIPRQRHQNLPPPLIVVEMTAFAWGWIF